MILDEIAVKHLCDKAGILPGRNGHDYARHYESRFSEMRHLPIRLLEIGVDRGASLRAWSEFFSEAKIVGVDVNPECSSVAIDRCNVVIGDQSDPEFWKRFKSQYGSEWEIIIDDGGHQADQMITSFGCLWPCVVGGGYYAIEDLGSAYPNYTQGRIRCDEVYLKNCVPSGWPNHMDFLKEVIDQVNLGSEVESIFFAKELAIVTKSKS